MQVMSQPLKSTYNIKELQKAQGLIRCLLPELDSCCVSSNKQNRQQQAFSKKLYITNSKRKLKMNSQMTLHTLASSKSGQFL